MLYECCSIHVWDLPECTKNVWDPADKVFNLDHVYLGLTYHFWSEIIFDQLITFNALSGLAPQYVVDLLDVYVSEQNHRLSSDRKLVVPAYILETYGRWSFRVSAPIVWNSLPQNIRLCDSIGTFNVNLSLIAYKNYRLCRIILPLLRNVLLLADFVKL